MKSATELYKVAKESGASPMEQQEHMQHNSLEATVHREYSGGDEREYYQNGHNALSQSNQSSTPHSFSFPSAQYPHGTSNSISTGSDHLNPEVSRTRNAMYEPTEQTFDFSSVKSQIPQQSSSSPSMGSAESKQNSQPESDPPSAAGSQRSRAFLCHEGTIKSGILSVLHRELKRQGLLSQVFYDMVTDRGGARDETLKNQFENALKNTDNLVVFFTPEFLQSPWPLWELKTFLSMMNEDRTRSKRLIPVFYSISARQCKRISRDNLGSASSNASYNDEVRSLLGRAVGVIGIDARRENNYMSDDQVVQEIMRAVFGTSFVAIENVDEDSIQGALMEQKQIAEHLLRYAEKALKGDKYNRKKKQRKAVHFLSAASYLGDNKAMVVLGNIYSRGQRGIARNDARAMELYVEAFSNGYAEAGVHLGNAALFGEGLPEDAQRAAECYQRSGECGSANGKARYGLCLELGLGVAVSHTEAAKYYKLSSDQGDLFGVCLYALCLRKGIGCKQNITGAERLFDRRQLGDILEVADYLRKNRVSPCKAVELYHCAAERGDNVAKCYMGMCYDDGIGVAQDKSRASLLYSKADNHGDVMRNLEKKCRENGDVQAADAWERRRRALRY